MSVNLQSTAIRQKPNNAVKNNDLLPIVNDLEALNNAGGGGVQSVTGNLVDNTDPANPVINSIEYISNAPVTQNYPTGGTQTFNLPITKNGNYLVTVHGTLRNNEITESGGVHSTIDITGSNGPRQYLSKIPAVGGQALIYNQRLVTITDYNTQIIDCNVALPGDTNWTIQNLIVSALIL